MNNNRNQSTTTLFFKYVSQNILGMIGVSAYVLADTFFISQSNGSNGIAALNLVLPIYSLLYAFGGMFGVGSATRFNILKSRGSKEYENIFTNAILWGVIVAIPFMFLGIFFPEKILSFFGADDTIISVGLSYTRCFLSFAPFFTLNIICNAFLRNDGNPSLAMIATFASSIFNIVMDYVFIFPLNMGMTGAALATGLSPIIGILLCMPHFFSKKSTIRFHKLIPNFKLIVNCSKLGISSFVAEISSGITTIVFNFLILSITGNVGIAAYGIIANTAIVSTALFNGIASGAQPLISTYHGRQDSARAIKTLRLALSLSLIFAFSLILFANLFSMEIINFFNSEKNQQMANLASTGIILYFIGYVFAGINIVGTSYLSSVESAATAFFASISRGFVAIILCAVILSHFLGMTGIWLAFACSELLTCFITIGGLFHQIRHKKTVF